MNAGANRQIRKQYLLGNKNNHIITDKIPKTSNREQEPLI